MMTLFEIQVEFNFVVCSFGMKSFLNENKLICVSNNEFSNTQLRVFVIWNIYKFTLMFYENLHEMCMLLKF